MNKVDDFTPKVAAPDTQLPPVSQAKAESSRLQSFPALWPSLGLADRSPVAPALDGAEFARFGPILGSP